MHGSSTRLAREHNDGKAGDDKTNKYMIVTIKQEPH